MDMTFNMPIIDRSCNDLTKINFGKHKGKTMLNIYENHYSYLKWLNDLPDFKDNMGIKVWFTKKNLTRPKLTKDIFENLINKRCGYSKR